MIYQVRVLVYGGIVTNGFDAFAFFSPQYMGWLTTGLNSTILSTILVGIISQVWIRRRHPRSVFFFVPVLPGRDLMTFELNVLGGIANSIMYVISPIFLWLTLFTMISLRLLEGR